MLQISRRNVGLLQCSASDHLNVFSHAELYPSVTNSPLAEQKNSKIRNLGSQMAYMKQTTLVWYLRYFLYRLNKVDELIAAGALFYTQNRYGT